MATVKTKDYDPLKVSILLGSHIAGGFADGTFVTINRNNQAWSLVRGASGESARAKSNDKSGTFELTLMQTSITNDFLTSKMLLDEAPGSLGKFPVVITDAHGLTVLAATEVWVQQPPSVEYGKEMSDRVWTLEAGDIDFYVGGTLLQGEAILTEGD